MWNFVVCFGRVFGVEWSMLTGLNFVCMVGCVLGARNVYEFEFLCWGMLSPGRLF